MTVGGFLVLCSFFVALIAVMAALDYMEDGDSFPLVMACIYTFATVIMWMSAYRFDI